MIIPARLVASYPGDADWSKHTKLNPGDVIFFTDQHGDRWIDFGCPCEMGRHEVPITPQVSGRHKTVWDFHSENPPHIEPSVLTKTNLPNYDPVTGEYIEDQGHEVVCHINLRPNGLEIHGDSVGKLSI